MANLGRKNMWCVWSDNAVCEDGSCDFERQIYFSAAEQVR